ncbi:MAG: ATP-dependent protease ATPase subunit HslU, partial [Spirochaetaceae bacterium]|nr:ATP-dependent protease ATPase subunit HslU [Spirochaetaceae bacterium]
LPGSGGKKRRSEKNDETSGKPVITPMGAFSINSDSEGGPSVLGTAIQVGIPIARKQRGRGKSAAEQAERELSEEEKAAAAAEKEKQISTREKFRVMLREGKFEEKKVEISVNQDIQMPSFGMMGNGLEEIESSLSGIAGIFGGNKKRKVLPVKRAREILMAEEAEKLVDADRVTEEARRRVQEMGIIFIDEIDKVAVKGDRGGGHDASREGVQRDILPIVEGAVVNTKWGPVDTGHILFIAAGAFNISKPADLIPELQGRFPLRVELESLGKDEFLRILTEPKNSLTKQYSDLLKTEDVELEFTPEAIEQLAVFAADVNSRLENIGARRLHTIMETLLEKISFDAPDIAPAKITITPDFVDERLKDITQDQDLGRYIL